MSKFIAIVLGSCFILWPAINSAPQEPLSANHSVQEAKELKQTLEMINKLPDVKANNQTREFYAHLINKNCKPETRAILVSILYVESKFDHMANNHNNDWGIAQINFKTWGKFFNINNALELYDPNTNIRAAMSILSMAKQVHGKKADWWSWYHSWNHMPRNKYAKKVHKILTLLGEEHGSGTNAQSSSVN